MNNKNKGSAPNGSKQKDKKSNAVSFSISPDDFDPMAGSKSGQTVTVPGSSQKFPDGIPLLAQPLKKWCIGFDVSIYTNDNSMQLTKLEPGNVVLVDRQYQPAGDPSLWSEISYTHYDKVLNKDQWVQNTVTGWVNDIFLDDYNPRFPDDNLDNRVSIPNPTADPGDAQQYMTMPDDKGFESVIRYNLCGELCTAFILKGSIDIVLSNWKNKPGSHYFSVLDKGQNDQTGPDDLIDLLRANLDQFGFGPDPDQIVKYFDPLKPNFKPTSADQMRSDLAAMMDKYSLILLGKINHNSGILINKQLLGDSHWIVIDKLVGNRVEVYNPFLNSREEYSIGEIYDTNQFAGVWVKRKAGSGLIPVDTAVPAFQVQLDTPKPPAMRAEQYIVREGGTKYELCGEFSTAYILGKSASGAADYWQNTPPQTYTELMAILRAYGYQKDTGQIKAFTIGTVLDHWRETQPDLYSYHVIENNPTGTRELVTILKAYGYTNIGDILDFHFGLTDSVTGQYLASPGRMKKMLEQYFFIAGVGINGVTGRLIDSNNAVRHWVVVESITPFGKHFIDPNGRRPPLHTGGSGGWVNLYNPFTNVYEEYSFMEFTNSMSPTGNWGGIWVKRSVQPSIKPQDVLAPSGDDAQTDSGNNKNNAQASKKWPAPKMSEQVNKMLNNGKAPDLILQAILKLNTGWSAAEIGALLPIQKAATPSVDFEKVLKDGLKVNSVPAEIVTWVGSVAKSDTSLALSLANTLQETGILVIDARSMQASLINTNNPGLADQIKTNISSLAGNPTPGEQLTQKVAGVIVPAFTKRALSEIKTNFSTQAL